MNACDECGACPAGISVCMTVNGTHLEVNLCHDCAQRRAQEGGIAFGVALGHHLNEGAGKEQGGHPLFDTTEYSSVCPSCGLTAQEFGQKELLGCDVCYVAHGALLRTVLETVQGIDYDPESSDPTTAHRLTQAKRVRELAEELEEAVRLEEYLKAAELRDRLQELRGER
jgi:protein arginine kinase activator